MGRILVADDHDSLRRGIVRALSDAHHEVDEAPNGNVAIEKLHEGQYDVVLSDLKMGGSDGMDVLRTAKSLQPDDRRHPDDRVRLDPHGGRGDEDRRLRLRAEAVRDRGDGAQDREGDRAPPPASTRSSTCGTRSRTSTTSTASSARAARCSRCSTIVKKVAKSNTTVLIRGETGTGKELIAGAIHHNSLRAGRNFVKVNCAALQENLLESELFGHEKGAFTGADKQRVGRFEQADGGTLFLDEIGDMSANTQAKILRVLQEHEFERLGGTRTLRVDVRRHRRDQPEPAADGRQRAVPRGPLLPAERRLDRHAAAARAQGRHPAAGDVLPPPLRRRAEEARRRAVARRAEAADALQLAGQHPRARERHRARGAADRRAAADRAPTCASASCRRRSRRATRARW